MTEHTKENILIVFALAVLVTLGWIGVYGQNENPAQIPAIETTAMKSNDATYSFDIEYPSFGNLKNKDIEKDLNEKIKSYIKETVDSFKQETAENVLIFKDKVRSEIPLIGIEPSAILTFRDEYPDLVGPELKEAAINLSKYCLLFEEFFMKEVNAGHITREQFTNTYLKTLTYRFLLFCLKYCFVFTCYIATAYFLCLSIRKKQQHTYYAQTYRQ